MDVIWKVFLECRSKNPPTDKPKRKMGFPDEYSPVIIPVFQTRGPEI